MRSKSTVILDATTLAGTTPVTSLIMPLDAVYSYALQAITKGTVFAGSYQLFGSCQLGDYEANGVTDWAPIDSAITISAAGSVITNKDGVGYRWFKVVFTPNSGTGTLTLVLNTKG
jgi:hypothetical protein